MHPWTLEINLPPSIPAEHIPQVLPLIHKNIAQSLLQFEQKIEQELGLLYSYIQQQERLKIYYTPHEMTPHPPPLESPSPHKHFDLDAVLEWDEVNKTWTRAMEHTPIPFHFVIKPHSAFPLRDNLPPEKKMEALLQNIIRLFRKYQLVPPPRSQGLPPTQSEDVYTQAQKNTNYASDTQSSYVKHHGNIIKSDLATSSLQLDKLRDSSPLEPPSSKAPQTLESTYHDLLIGQMIFSPHLRRDLFASHITLPQSAVFFSASSAPIDQDIDKFTTTLLQEEKTSPLPLTLASWSSHVASLEEKTRTFSITETTDSLPPSPAPTQVPYPALSLEESELSWKKTTEPHISRLRQELEHSQKKLEEQENYVKTQNNFPQYITELVEAYPHLPPDQLLQLFVSLPGPSDEQHPISFDIRWKDALSFQFPPSPLTPPQSPPPPHANFSQTFLSQLLDRDHLPEPSHENTLMITDSLPFNFFRHTHVSSDIENLWTALIQNINTDHIADLEHNKTLLLNLFFSALHKASRSHDKHSPSPHNSPQYFENPSQFSLFMTTFISEFQKQERNIMRLIKERNLRGLETTITSLAKSCYHTSLTSPPQESTSYSLETYHLCRRYGQLLQFLIQK